jgi:hypothetical protein
VIASVAVLTLALVQLRAPGITEAQIHGVAAKLATARQTEAAA